jgi:hypothetical protein
MHGRKRLSAHVRAIRFRLHTAQEGVCPYCGRRLARDVWRGVTHAERPTVDHVIPRKHHGECEVVRDTDNRPPTDEIEVTPEMIEAGSRVLETAYLGDGRYALDDDLMKRMFLAMRASIG